MKNKVLFLLLVLILSVVLSSGMQLFAQESGKLRVAACQFPISSNISENYNWIKKQVIEAKLKKADVVHFAECALSGYPGTDMNTLDNLDWNLLFSATDSLMSLAKELKIWIILGSIHRLSGNNKPHNSLYVINAEGEIVDRYDKRFCTTADLKYFSPGDHFVTFGLNGVKCGLLICYDVRFPELYREYKKLEVDMIFQSFNNAREEPGNVHPVIIPITAQASAASNYFYMSLTNSSAPESWPCYFITPDGIAQNKLTDNVPGVLISDIDLSRKYWGSGQPFTLDAIKGKLNSGQLVKDPKSADRKSLHQ